MKKNFISTVLGVLVGAVLVEGLVFAGTFLSGVTSTSISANVQRKIQLATASQGAATSLANAGNFVADLADVSLTTPAITTPAGACTTETFAVTGATASSQFFIQAPALVNSKVIFEAGPGGSGTLTVFVCATKDSAENIGASAITGLLLK